MTRGRARVFTIGKINVAHSDGNIRRNHLHVRQGIMLHMDLAAAPLEVAADCITPHLQRVVGADQRGIFSLERQVFVEVLRIEGGDPLITQAFDRWSCGHDILFLFRNSLPRVLTFDKTALGQHNRQKRER